ncbi:MAG: site-specific integrase [Candidatus Thiodiazotropha taylori]|nr:site-specific integrase [Candidatus Thiodiazotropha taylori]
MAWQLKTIVSIRRFNMASIIRREGKNGITYQAKVRKGGRMLSKSFTRKTDAAEWAKQIETDISRGQLASPKAMKMSVGELIDYHIAEEMDDLKTGKDRIRHLNWWRGQIGEVKLADVSPGDLTDSVRKLKKGRSPSTVNRYVGSLSPVFSTAVRLEWLAANPVSKVKRLKEPRGRIRFLSEDRKGKGGQVIEGERTRLLRACSESRSPVLYDIVVLALSTGMRQGEIMNLTWKDVDLKHGHVTLRDTKNSEVRGVPVTGLALVQLKKRAKVRRIDTNLVFPDRAGDAPAKFRDAWLAALERAEIEDFRFHDLRHSAASYLAMSGATLAEIAEILGHKTLAMVKRYSHLSTEHISAVISKLDDRMFGGETDEKAI